MVTTCANCRQQLAVTAADLRIGQGYVRCGRCEKVFNALLTLAEDEPAPTEPDSVAHGTRSIPALEADDPLPPIPGHEDGPLDPLDEEVEVVQTHATGRFQSIVLGDTGEARELDADAGLDDAAGASVDVDAATGAGIELAPAMDAERDEDAEAAAGRAPWQDAPSADAPSADASAQDAQRDEVARQIIRQATSQPIDVLLEEPQGGAGIAAAAHSRGPRADEVIGEFDADAAVGNPRRASPLWYLLALLLAVALLAQFIHHNRQQLVTVAWLTTPIQWSYAIFGQDVEPPWDLARYEVQQLGAAQSPGNRTLTLQAAVAVSVGARWAQPPPVLRVVLSDRWGNVLTTTDLPPQDWILGDAPARLAPGQRVDARLTLPAPERVSGFALAACLPDSAGGLRCRDDGR